MKKIIQVIFILTISIKLNAQTEKGDHTVIRGGFGYSYIFSAHKTNRQPSNALFQSNGQQIGFRWTPLNIHPEDGLWDLSSLPAFNSVIPVKVILKNLLKA